MSLQDVIQDHFTPADKTNFDSIMASLMALMGTRLRNLSEDENQLYGTIDEKNKLLVNKDKDYHDNQPALSSGAVNWPEFDANHFDRGFLQHVEESCLAMAKAAAETRRMHDFDNYQNALVDYKYTKFMSETQGGIGYDTKYNELKQFFPNG